MYHDPYKIFRTLGSPESSLNYLRKTFGWGLNPLPLHPEGLLSFTASKSDFYFIRLSLPEPALCAPVADGELITLHSLERIAAVVNGDAEWHWRSFLYLPVTTDPHSDAAVVFKVGINAYVEAFL